MVTAHNYIADLIKYNKAFTFKLITFFFFFTDELVAFIMLLQLGFMIYWFKMNDPDPIIDYFLLYYLTLGLQYLC